MKYKILHLISACCLVLGFAGVASGANAAEFQIQAVEGVAIPAAHAKSKSPVYIVMMRDDPAVAYDGGIGKLKATKPSSGKKINPNSAHVKKYVSYLDSTHDDVLSSVGAGEKTLSPWPLLGNRPETGVSGCRIVDTVQVNPG